ncbi:hypothetical protein PGT21_028842 [Puccinia graminis f. sp. tritici]|uniref:Uncharacterized protein n=1 Tax=Puccinia graminis f. sp. tritici TaxID=56615 RepID=A0A5B0PJI0_PUCGR|nr:hypothetical protein PGT21_028842 [Puccinia graminis f. sp. tritici]
MAGAASHSVAEDITHAQTAPITGGVEESPHRENVGTEHSIHPLEAQAFEVEPEGNQKFSPAHTSQTPENHCAKKQKLSPTNDITGLLKPLTLQELFEIIAGEAQGEEKLRPFIEELEEYTRLEKNSQSKMNKLLKI